MLSRVLTLPMMMSGAAGVGGCGGVASTVSGKSTTAAALLVPRLHLSGGVGGAVSRRLLLASPATAPAPATAGSSTNLLTLALASGITALFVTTASPSIVYGHVEEKSGKERIVQNYEIRLRQLSTPEKIFDYFASVVVNGEKFMTPYDFMRAITPSARPLADGEKFRVHPDVEKFFKVFDVNNDGYISYHEYTFFLTLLAIPYADFKIVFGMMDADGSGTLSSKEFSQVMKVLKGNTPFGQQDRGGRRSFADKPDNFVTSISELPVFFGKDGEKELTFKEFREFLVGLQDCVLRLEFDSFDRDGNGSISAGDFALTLIAQTDVKLHNDLSRRAHEIKKLMPNVQFTFEEFRNFNIFLKNIKKVDVALSTYLGTSGGKMTRESIQRAARAAAKVNLSPLMTEVLFRLFDRDHDGNLDPEEFLDVLEKKASYGLQSPRHFGISGFFTCCKHCFQDV